MINPVSYTILLSTMFLSLWLHLNQNPNGILLLWLTVSFWLGWLINSILLKFTWQILFADYLDRFSQKLAYFANLTILTQMIYVGDGNIRADYRADSKSYTLDEDQVASLINALEPKLGKYPGHTLCILILRLLWKPFYCRILFWKWVAYHK